MTPNIGILEEHRAWVLTIQNNLLSTERRNCHWSVIGLPKLFEAQ